MDYLFKGCKNCKRKAYKMSENDQEIVDANAFSEGLRCYKCFPKPPVLYPSYKVNVHVTNDSGSISLTLFENLVTKLVHISFYDLRKKYLDATPLHFPEELYDIVGLKMLFKISVTEYNIMNIYRVYKVSDCTDNEDAIEKWQKNNLLDESATSIGDKANHIDLTTNSEETVSGKRRLDEQENDSMSLHPTGNKATKRLKEVKMEQRD